MFRTSMLLTVLFLAGAMAFTTLPAQAAELAPGTEEGAGLPGERAEPSAAPEAAAYGCYYKVYYYSHGCQYYYGTYYCYSSACDAAYHLRCKGYPTCITRYSY